MDVASDAVAATAMARSDGVDLVILDLGLPAVSAGPAQAGPASPGPPRGSSTSTVPPLRQYTPCSRFMKPSSTR